MSERELSSNQKKDVLCQYQALSDHNSDVDQELAHYRQKVPQLCQKISLMKIQFLLQNQRNSTKLLQNKRQIESLKEENKKLRALQISQPKQRSLQDKFGQQKEQIARNKERLKKNQTLIEINKLTSDKKKIAEELQKCYQKFYFLCCIFEKSFEYVSIGKNLSKLQQQLLDQKLDYESDDHSFITKYEVFIQQYQKFAECSRQETNEQVKNKIKVLLSKMFKIENNNEENHHEKNKKNKSSNKKKKNKN